MSADRSPLDTRVQVEYLTGLGVAALMIFMGTPVTLVALGLIDPDNAPEGVGRVVALLFGGGIVIAGVRLIALPLLAFARARGAADWLGALWIAATRLLVRPTLSSVIAAAFLAPVVLSYWLRPDENSSWGLSYYTLIHLVTIEFLVIHGFPFLVFAAMLIRSPKPAGRRLGIGAVAFLLLLYSAFAWNSGRWGGIAALLYLVLPNVMAFAHPADHWSVPVLAVSRWGLKFMPLLVIAIWLGERDVTGAGNLRIGLWYFPLLALMELFRIMELPLDLSEEWARLPFSVRQGIPVLRQTR